MRALIALGGNALVKPGSTGEISEQFECAYSALKDIVKLIHDGHKIIITHGNGFQVGNIITRSELSKGRAYDIPLYIADAQTQGEIGFIIQQTLINELCKAGIFRKVVVVLTQVVVDKNDDAFKNPTKPVGRYYTEAEMEVNKKPDEVWKEDSGRGWRKLVPSPLPIDIVEKDTIKELFEFGTIVIAVGGGGIPVINEGGILKGVEAVIDKDLASALLASQIDVDRFIILTGVERVALNFGKPNEERLARLSAKLARSYMEEGHFHPGSMGPKIKSALNFLEQKPEGEVIITSLDKLYSAFYGSEGTHIYS